MIVFDVYDYEVVRYIYFFVGKKKYIEKIEVIFIRLKGVRVIQNVKFLVFFILGYKNVSNDFKIWFFIL